jgi:hypothetical protein
MQRMYFIGKASELMQYLRELIEYNGDVRLIDLYKQID